MGVETAKTGNLFPARAYDEQSMAGKILHIDRNGNGLPATRSVPAKVISTWSARRSTPWASAIRSVSHSDLAAASSLATWVGRCGRRSTWSVPRVEGTTAGPASKETSRRLAIKTSAPHRSTTPRPQIAPTYAYPHVGSNSVVGGPTYTGNAYPTGFRNSIFFGDFTGGFIRRLVPNGSGGFSAQPFANNWGGVALETAPNGDLVSVNPVNFQQSGLGTVTRLVYRQPAPAQPAAPPALPPPAAPAAPDRRAPAFACARSSRAAGASPAPPPTAAASGT